MPQKKGFKFQGKGHLMPNFSKLCSENDVGSPKRAAQLNQLNSFLDNYDELYLDSVIYYYLDTGNVNNYFGTISYLVNESFEENVTNDVPKFLFVINDLKKKIKILNINNNLSILIEW